MASRILFRLAVAWLALLGLLWLYAYSIQRSADFEWMFRPRRTER